MQLVVSLGALLADVPHSLPVHISGSASDPALTERLGLHPTGYEGPTGIVGVLHAVVRRPRHPVGEPVGERPPLRRRRAEPEGRAGAACASSRAWSASSVDGSELEAAATDYERQVGLAVQSDPDVQAFVERLEQLAQDERGDEDEDIPSGDRIAREFQRFLRQRGDAGDR